MMPGVVPVFAGLIIPLPLFPGLAAAVLYWQPFRAWPTCRSASTAATSRCRGAAGTAESVACGSGHGGFGYWLLSRARRNLVVQGG